MGVEPGTYRSKDEQVIMSGDFEATKIVFEGIDQKSLRFALCRLNLLTVKCNLFLENQKGLLDLGVIGIWTSSHLLRFLLRLKYAVNI
jgi:hypothetical protein